MDYLPLLIPNLGETIPVPAQANLQLCVNHAKAGPLNRQVTRKKFKSGAVVKHQRTFVVFETTSSVKGLLRVVLRHSTTL